MEVQRPAAEDPEDEPNRDRGPADQGERRRKEHEGQGREHRGEEDPPLASLRHSASPEEGRDRHRQPREAACERNPREQAWRRGHLSLEHVPVVACKGPEALADDHDAVRPGHAAEPGEGFARIGTPKDLGQVHLHTVPERRPPGKGQAACSTGVLVLLPVAAREEAQQRENQNHDEDDPKNAQ